MRTFALLALAFVAVPAIRSADDKPEDSARAAKTRMLLKTKIDADWKDARLEDVMNEIKEEVKGLTIIYDTGVSKNRTLTFKAKGKVTVEEALDKLFEKAALGYVVISKKGDAYDGSVKIRMSKERGYPAK